MGRTIWLITEGRAEAEIVTAIVKRHLPRLRVERLHAPGKNPNLSLLASHLEALIETARERRRQGDCIVVLHDADFHTRVDRADYERIARICKAFAREVRHVIAKDEIEAWLLADEGFCMWLGVPAKNWDEQKQPSETLRSLLDKRGKPRYRLDNLSKILIEVNGVTKSPTLQKELDYLNTASCADL
jgi:hypothetical protein